ncbi:unnamed protein product [Staurois parvus]|uniref:Uncharacterized protein n=1 Tax=Staurois parvus TaxID=386267 RepID=A0ABN9C8S2_9NEOB|nr:unnamed protein product [Staurois parvus]
MSLFKFFYFPPVPFLVCPIRPDTRREQHPEDRCRHRPEDMAGDAAGGTSRERRTR